MSAPMLRREILDLGPLSIPGLMPAPGPELFLTPAPKPPALGGRGTERIDIDPRSATRMLLFAIGLCTPPLFIGIDERCAFIVCLFIGIDERCAFIVCCEPTSKPGRPPMLALLPALLRIPEGVDMRLTTGRAKLRGGGAAALIPLFGPSIVVLVGFTSSE
jgi:hypothetical protein